MAKKNKSFTSILEVLSEVEFSDENINGLCAIIDQMPESATTFKNALMLVYQLIETLEVALSESDDGWKPADR